MTQVIGEDNKIHFLMEDCVHYEEKKKQICPWQLDLKYCDSCQDYIKRD